MSGNDLTIEEPETRAELWYEWLNYRIRHYMMSEVLFLFLFGLLLTNSYRIHAQNDRTYQLILDLSSRMEVIERQMAIKKEAGDFVKEPSKDFVYEPSKPLASTPATIGSFNTIKPSMNYSSNLINAANFLNGARINNLKMLGREELMLLDRPNPPKSAEWCTEKRDIIVNVGLSRYIKPVYVSYQHSKWNGIVPKGAPKTYDVVACLDYDCTSLDYLVSNCQYTSENKEQEQKCFIQSNPRLPPIKGVRFQFRENHGNVKETCIGLLRVYGEMSERQKDAKQIENDANVCETLAWRYYNHHLLYIMSDKNCTTLYQKECCDECPECCTECLVNDWTLLRRLIFISIFLLVILFCCLCCFFCRNIQ